MLLPMENLFCMSTFIALLIQLFSLFGKLNGIELPIELLHEDVKNGKSIDFTRRMAFPLAVSENAVELPPNTEDNMELNAPNTFVTTTVEDNDDLEYELPVKSEMPKWLKIQLQTETQQQPKYHHPVSKPKSTYSGIHENDNRQAHSSKTYSAATSPLKRCSIEISSKIPGICQGMGSIGNACVSGDYIDVFNAECL